MALADLPEVLTVEEAAGVLRISRTAAYGQAQRWLATNGREGLPVVRIGRSLRVPRAGLEHLLGAAETTPSAPVISVVASERKRWQSRS